MEWKPVKEYEGLYEVSEGGQVRRCGAGQGAVAGKIRKPQPNIKTGYHQLILSKNNVATGHYVHRLVAEAFYGASELQVNHINGDISDNALINLEFVTPAENIQHAIATGLRKVAA